MQKLHEDKSKNPIQMVPKDVHVASSQHLVTGGIIPFAAVVVSPMYEDKIE